MTNHKMVLIYVTCSNEDESAFIGKSLVGERLCACCNIFSAIKSFYWWNDSLEEDTESVLILKTIDKNIEESIKKIKSLHSYDNPCIIVLPVINASNDYLKWINTEIHNNLDLNNLDLNSLDLNNLDSDSLDLDYMDLISNLDKLHTTELGLKRIEKNLSLNVEDAVKWAKEKIENPQASITKKGKN
ncbi:MAG: divalent cation tolerance protein CutA, partial [Methanobrevibacter sp.]|nr:divalent cation tolerance protein CutA [Methanobrevibacter sp.]